MATSSLLPSILQSKFFSPTKFSSNGGDQKPAKPIFLRSNVIAFSKKQYSKKKTVLDDFMEEEEEEFVRVSKKKPKFIEVSTKERKFNALDDFMEEEEQEDFIQVSKHKQKIKKLKKSKEEESEEEEFNMGEGLEAFFSQLERDINNYDPSKEEEDFNGEIKEEDVKKLEKELSQALGEEEEEDSEFEDDLIELPELKTWQMRKIAYALKIGKRKASIKKLSEDVCIERSIVLEFLRNPPPNLLLMSESLPNEPGPHEPSPQKESDTNTTESVNAPSHAESAPVDPVRGKNVTRSGNGGVVHKDQVRGKHGSGGQKRLKQVQVDTLEKVYLRMKRPTDEMIESIIHVTNLPRKRVVKWFEERRIEDGVPNQPPPRPVFRRSARTKTQTVVSTR